MSNFFENIGSPQDIKKLDIEELNRLADFLREKIIGTISRTGGHLASSLGTVELTVALHYVFDSPRDKIIWDVGHQCYAHKLLTGRMKKFDTIRQYQGLSGFTKCCESPYDCFGAGHSSTSISGAVGFARARDHMKEDYHVVAVIGDGAMGGGMAFEALNHAGSLDTDMTVILNDNEMSISKNVGALAHYLSRLRMQPHYVKFRDAVRAFVKQIPRIGMNVLHAAEVLEEHLIYFMIPGVVFESLGFMYLGPFDGHNIDILIKTLQRSKELPGPKLIHLKTCKGKGYLPAEKDSTKWHGAIPFDINTGNGVDPGSTSIKNIPDYSKVFCDTLIQLAKKDPRIVAITAAMLDGTGLGRFKEEFPDRLYDVGIAEQHAVTFSAGLAGGGMKPVVAIYSTFLQRAYDQIFHDVCLQNLPVVFAIDRGGLVGEDGPTHHGVFDLTYLRSLPNIIIMAPGDENELQNMLHSALEYNKPTAIRYPRGKGIGVQMDSPDEWEIIPPGKGHVMVEGENLALLAVGSMVYPCWLAGEKLRTYGFNPYVVNMRFIKPLDEELIVEMAKKTRRIVTVEENTLCGGFGSGVIETLHRHGIHDCYVQNIGIPDRFIEHGHMGILREKYGLTSKGIVEKIIKSIQTENGV